MDKTQFNREVVKLIAIYAAGVTDGSYERMMDDLSVSVTDNQWRAVLKAIEIADCALAETDKGTLYQKTVLAEKGKAE